MTAAKQRRDPARPNPLLDKKSLRVIRAALDTPYDTATKMVLIVYAMTLNSKRRDWCSWLSVRTLSKESGVKRDAIISARRYLIRDRVLTEFKGGTHPLQRNAILGQKKSKHGRPSTFVGVNVKRLEQLARNFTVTDLRPSRSRRRILTELAQVRALRAEPLAMAEDVVA
jgi:hypothetical protein